jgi:hypothetical protein
MSHAKPIDKLDIWDRARPEPTPWTFVRAAGLANLLVATMVVVEFSVIAWVDYDPKAFRFGLWAVPIVTLITWATAAVLHFLESFTEALRALGRRLVGGTRSFPSARRGVWDDWLDRPEPHDR